MFEFAKKEVLTLEHFKLPMNERRLVKTSGLFKPEEVAITFEEFNGRLVELLGYASAMDFIVPVVLEVKKSSDDEGFWKKVPVFFDAE